MAEEKRKLADRSNRLLAALRRLRDIEKVKRQTPISTPAFHRLAEEVEQTSREIFRLAREQERLGDEIPRGPDDIESVDLAAREDAGA
jgi:hypothetical protein